MAVTAATFLSLRPATALAHATLCASSGRIPRALPTTPPTRRRGQEGLLHLGHHGHHLTHTTGSRPAPAPRRWRWRRGCTTPGPEGPPLDLTEENVERVLAEARTHLLQLFDTSVGITGVAELAELDGPFVTLRLRGRFWHQRATVLARLAHFLQQRIPEVVEVQVEDPAQLDDSASNF